MLEFKSIKKWGGRRNSWIKLKLFGKKLGLRKRWNFVKDRDMEELESVKTRYNEKSRGMTNCRGPSRSEGVRKEEGSRFPAHILCMRSMLRGLPSALTIRKGKLHFSNVSRGGEFDRGHTQPY